MAKLEWSLALPQRPARGGIPSRC